MQETLAALQGINSILVAANPMIAAATALGIALIKQIRANGTDIKPFADEIAKFESALAGGVAVDDAWRLAHGLPTWGAPNA